VSKYKLISIDTILSKVYREIKQAASIEESDIIEYIGESLEAIGAFGQYEEDICFIEIDNFRGNLPNGLVEIIQVAASMKPVEPSKCISDTDTKDCDSYCEDEALNECWSQHNKYYIPAQRYLDAIYEYDLRWKFNSYFFSNFIPMRLSTNTFRGFNAKVGSQQNEFGVNAVGGLEYHISNNQIITTFQKGTVAISYTRMPLDEKGFPMIPDLQSYKEAITKYIMYKLAFERFYNNEPNFRGIYQQLEADWHWYCRQAKNSMMMPTTLDEKQNMKDINHRMLKIQRGHNGFFGQINTPETFTTNGRRNRI